MERYHILFIVLGLVLALGVQVQAAKFAGGSGRWDDPYQIATAEQLISIGSDLELLESHFVLIADIDLDPNLSEDFNFTAGPIGYNFSGVFDGRGHRIRNLTITDNTTGEDIVDCGLFQYIGWAGEVKRLVLEDVRIISYSDHGVVGAVCSQNGGLILQCSATGIVSGTAAAGGLVGSNLGTVEECYTGCTVSGSLAGGVAGYSWGIVCDCHTDGRVSGEVAGGIVGNKFYGAVNRCYSTCHVEPGAASGGLVGSVHRFLGVLEDSYFLDPSDGGGPDNGFGTPLTSEQMKDPGSFAGFRFWEADTREPRGLWYARPGDYPKLVWQAVVPVFRAMGLSAAEACEAIETDGARVSSVVYDYDFDTPAGYAITGRPHSESALGDAFDIVVSLGFYDWTENPGMGTTESPYLIFSAGQVDALASDPALWSKHFRLASDLDLACRVYGRALIGLSDWDGGAFEGTFEGNGHLIKNLTIEGVGTVGWGTPRLGLFGEIGASGHVQDLGLVGVSVRARGGHAHTGGMICAINAGRIERSYSVGAIGGQQLIGGLVGRNEGEIEDCYAQGDVRVVRDEDSYYHAGLVAQNLGGTIQTCYAACSVPSGRGWGLVGSNNNGLVTEQSLWDVEVSGVYTSQGGMGLPTEELMSAEVLQGLGWGNSGHWKIDDGNDYPRLVWERAPGNPIGTSDMGG